MSAAEHQIIERPSNGAVATMTAATAIGDLLGELELPAVPESVPRARAFARTTATAAGVGGMRDDAEILVSELTTNAVRHAGATGGGTLRLLLVRIGTRLRIEVHDSSSNAPKTPFIDLLDETGRGWFLVAAIAERHGTDPTPTGKVVWCEVTAWPPAMEPLL